MDNDSSFIIHAHPIGHKGHTDSESIEAQLDRLNFTLQGLLKNDEKEFCDSFSFQGFDPVDTDEEMFEKLDNFMQKYDRSLMVIEDFRSFAVRKDAKNSKILKVQCKLTELYEVKYEVERAIKALEEGIIQKAKLKIGETQILIDVCMDSVFAAKKPISKGFLQKTNEKIHVDPYVTQLENEVEVLKNTLFFGFDPEIEKKMYESYNEIPVFPSTFSEKPHFSQDFHTQVSLEIEYKTMKHLNQNKESIIKELEWECAEVKSCKQNYEEKLKNMQEKEINLGKYIKSIQSEIEKKVKLFESEKIKLKEDKEKIVGKEVKLRTQLNKLKEEASALKNALNCESVLINTTNTPCATPKNREISSSVSTTFTIEQEIQLLEEELERAPDKSAVTFKINHLKNKLSADRSEKVLNSHETIKKFNSFSFARSTAATPRAVTLPRFDFTLDLQKIPVPSTPKLSNGRAFTCFRPQNNEFSCDPSPQTTTRSSNLCVNSENLEKDENLVKLLELKDARLRKKEDEILKQEVLLQKTWMKVPNANELIPIVQNQMIAYRAKFEELEKKYGEVDTVIRDNLQTRLKIREIEENSRKIMKNLQDKLKSAEKLESLCSQLANISV